MKLIALLLIALPCLSYSQSSPYYENPKTIAASMEKLAPHGRLTQMTFFDYNFVSERVQEFLREEMALTVDESKTKYSTSQISQTFHEALQVDNQADTDTSFEVIYDVFPNGNSFTIENVKMVGYSDHVIEFFVRYWNTDLNAVNTRSKEYIMNSLLQDRVGLTIAGNTSTIQIENTTIENRGNFLASLSN